MTKLNNEIRELSIDELDIVSGGDKGVVGWLHEIVDTANKAVLANPPPPTPVLPGFCGLPPYGL
jgi:hypothetical protein